MGKKELNALLVNETNTPNTSIGSYRLPLTFILLILDKFTDERENKYKVFLDENKVSYVECIMPQGKNIWFPERVTQMKYLTQK